jgi:two-component system cell cycle response regulator DivK
MARILVVDDRVENRDLLSYLLGYFGHQVSTAPGGAAAVRAALADPPDLIVMDIDMPGIDGYAAARLIRTEAALRDLPLVAVSATGTASPEKAHAAGFDAFYPLPIEPRDFVDWLEPFLRGRDAAGDRSRSEA